VRDRAADRRLEDRESLSMPSLAAGLIASIGSYVIDALIGDYVGMGTRLFIGLIDSILLYYYARRWLVNLRDGL
jgi:hypothetical protein